MKLLPLALILLLTACQSAPRVASRAADKPTTPVIIEGIHANAREAKSAIGTAIVTVEAVTPETVEAQKPVIIEQLHAVERPIDKIILAAPQAKASSMGDNSRELEKDATIEKLRAEIKAKDESEIRKSLLVSIIACVFGVVIGVLLLMNGAPKVGIGLIAGCTAGIAVSIAAIVYLAAIALIVFWTVAGAISLAVGGGIWWFVHRQRADATSLIQANKVAAMAGALDLSEAAPFFRAVQTPGAAKLVNRVAGDNQSSYVPAAPTPTASVPSAQPHRAGGGK